VDPDASSVGRIELALSEYLIAQHGGQIAWKHGREAGSVMTITLPVDQQM
jgi:K+-sensing histidine kinase KdpD